MGDRPPRSPGVHPRLLAAAAALVLAVTVLHAVVQLRAAWAFDTDDAFITLRYARNWVEGHGIVWNPGEAPPVEGYSNFSYLLVAALALAAGGDPLLALKTVGAASSLLTIPASYLLARRWMTPIGAAVPGLVLVAYQGTAKWAVSGLETATYQLLVLLAIWTFLCGLGVPGSPRPPGPDGASPRRGWLVASGIACLLAALTRPEGPLLVAMLLAVGAASAWRRGGREARREMRALAVLAATFVIPYAVYFAWRCAHFERLLPNTVICKTTWQGPPLTLIVPFAELAWPAAVLTLFARRHAGWYVVWGLCLVYVAALYGADPVVGEHNRHFLGVLGPLVILACAGATSLLARIPRVPQLAAEALVAAVVAGVVLDRLPELERVTAYDAHAYSRRQGMRAEVARLLDRTLPPDATFVVGDAGLTGYLARRTIIDPYCLNTRELTEPPISFSMDRFTAWTLDRQPDAIVVPSVRADRLQAHIRYGYFPRLLENPRFSEYELLARVPDPGGHYNSFIFVRRDGATPGATSDER